VAWKIRVPAILFLLAGGILLGPLAGWLNPDELFGDLLFPFISLSVAVILFEGSLTLKYEEIEGHGDVVRNLITIGVLMLWVMVAALTHYVIGAKWPIAFLFGAIMTVTGPTVIMPMLRAVRPNQKIANILRWEGILVDPLGAILAVLTFNVILAIQLGSGLGETVWVLAKMISAGLVIGGAAGYAWGLALSRYWVPSFLHNIATLLVVFAVYALADLIEGEAGLLAVTVMGIWLANTRGLHIDEILDFKESLSILLISGLFILLAARLDFDQLRAVGWPALLVLLGIQFVARPLKIFVCSIGSQLTWQEKATLAWIGPRGIIAAAISAVFALRLEQQGFPEAAFLVPLAFVIIAGTVILQSLTAGPLARMLKVADPEPEGVLIVGANSFTQVLAKSLHENGFAVLVADTSWDSLRNVRMAGIATYYGTVVSDHAERTMDLSGIGSVFAMTHNLDFNYLVCAHFLRDFGRQNVYTLPVSPREEGAAKNKQAPADGIRSRRLFDAQTSLMSLLQLVHRGAVIKTTHLRENFSYAEYLEMNGGQRVPLVAWNEKGRLVVITPDDEWQPGQDWTIASLYLPSGDGQPEKPSPVNPDTASA
jgi:CPA1 family monovalent cation:H+ antiporter